MYENYQKNEEWDKLKKIKKKTRTNDANNI